MSQPSIYIATSTFLPVVGGVERQALLQGQCLRRRGCEATVVTLQHENNWPACDVIEGVPVVRVAGHVLSGRARLPAPLRKLAYFVGLCEMGWRLWRDRRRYDVVHQYQLNLLTLPIALACWFGNKPLLIGVCAAPRDEAGIGPDGYSLVAGPLDVTTPWLKVAGSASAGGDLEQLERLGKPVVHFTRFLLRRVRAVVIVLSSRMEQYLSEHDFIVPDIRLIPNGVDINRFSPALSDCTSVPAVTCVAQLRYEKGVDVLLQAWRLLHASVPHARLLIVGDGLLRPQLKCLAEALAITDSVRFMGEQRDVSAQLRGARLAVLPSRSEGMPNALLEAMSCGLPCVATRVSGSEDVVQSGVNGLLVAPGDYRGMARAMHDLLCNPEVAERYGHAARATVERAYALDHIIDHYLEIYRELARRQSG